MEKSHQKQIAGEILRQLGGHRFIAMSGASNFGCFYNGDGNVVTTFKIGKNSKGITHVRIEYTEGSDLYDMSFIKNGYNKKQVYVHTIVANHEQVYCDMLVPLFEQETGMRTNLT
jgi:hypothetical protein